MDSFRKQITGKLIQMQTPTILNTGFLDFVYEFYSRVSSEEVVMTYEGEISHQVMKTFVDIIDQKMSKEEEPLSVQRRVFHIMVESLQNIAKHAFRLASPHVSELNHGILMVSRNKDRYFIITGNVIETKKAGSLECSLTGLNMLNKKELDELFKNQLLEGSISERGGAGLGLIDIRRKTGNELEFHFIRLDDRYSFFIFISSVSRY